jgi:hypothetical protein
MKPSSPHDEVSPHIIIPADEVSAHIISPAREELPEHVLEG